MLPFWNSLERENVQKEAPQPAYSLRIGLRAPATVVDARFIAPLDEHVICGLAKSVGRIVTVEETFERDISDRALLHAEIRLMAAAVAESLVKRQLSARTVTAKLRYSDFSIRSRSTSRRASWRTGSRPGTSRPW